MPRPSIKEKRTEEILIAYERCIALYGVDGATLHKIAEKAGIARPLLRHNVGNSSDLLAKAVERFLTRTRTSMQDFEDAKIANMDTFLDCLFDMTLTETQYNDTMIASALIVASQTRPEIKTQMQEWLENIKTVFLRMIRHIFPDADPDLTAVVTTGVIGIYFNVDALQPLEDSYELRNISREAAHRLLSLLK